MDLDTGTTTLVLSLHALQGYKGHNTMRLSAKIWQVDVIILVDSGSTHNFVDSKIVKRGNLPVEQASQMKIMIAKRGSLCIQGLCRVVEWQAQCHKFVTDFIVLSVKGCDLTKLNMSPALAQKDLQQLLMEYNDVFRVPDGLPLARIQDHKIPLQYKAKVVNVRP
ncbi:Aspartic peptidase [Gossypium australe]|uniref:Aspartic peptidase n=1 Tax=Gossypium australe TaxID=47621 RepID=A0A5B6WIU3_9ROSI|nr:Aspartic peptidase [Gossypium australe]